MAIEWLHYTFIVHAEKDLYFTTRHNVSQYLGLSEIDVVSFKLSLIHRSALKFFIEKHTYATASEIFIA